MSLKQHFDDMMAFIDQISIIPTRSALPSLKLQRGSNLIQNGQY
jgi:hypothetical protein